MTPSTRHTRRTLSVQCAASASPRIVLAFITPHAHLHSHRHQLAPSPFLRSLSICPHPITLRRSFSSRKSPTQPHPHIIHNTATPLPSSFEDMRAHATESALAAVSAGEKLIEISFPPVSNMATAALNELLDSNRSYARDFLFACRPRFPPSTLHAVFPDAAEARLAARYYGPDRPFFISALPGKERPAFTDDNPPGLIVVVSPGFNVSEWIAMEKLEGSLPVIAINADLDKVRGGYYPRLFYPGLHAVKDRFLSRFCETYYLKMFSNGGTLLRRYPDIWRLFYRSRSGEVMEVWSGEQRPEFKDVERLLVETREKDVARP